MSIYATLWTLKFPRYGDAFTGCDWIKVYAQGVPAHIGTPTPGYGYEGGDPYASFLPPAVEMNEVTATEEEKLRAVVFVTEDTPKETPRSPQEYVSPLLVITGEEYQTIRFDYLCRKISGALRGERPRVLAEIGQADGSIRVLFDDDSSITVPSKVRPLGDA